MKREEIKNIFPDATDEQLKAVMDLNGTDVEKVKSKVTALEAELKDKKEDSDKLNAELEALKTANASGEEWKSKYEAIVAENEAKAKQAEAERLTAAKNADIEKRFNACVGDKEYAHEAIKAAHLKSFAAALDSEEYKGKGDAEIYHALTKDDAAAFKGVTVVNLAGGRPSGTSGKTRDEIMAIKDGNARRAEMLANAHLFPELNK